MSGERVVADNSSAAAAVLSLPSSSAPPQSNAGVSGVRAFTSLYYPTSAEGGAMAKIMTQSSGDPLLPNYRGVFSDDEWRYFSAFDFEVEFWASPADPIGLFSSSTSHLAAGGDLGPIVGSSSSNNHSGAQRASTGTKRQKKKKMTGTRNESAFFRGPSSAPSSSGGSTAQNGPSSSLFSSTFSHHRSSTQQNATAFISSGGLTSTTGHNAATTTTPNQSFTQAQLNNNHTNYRGAQRASTGTKGQKKKKTTGTEKEISLLRGSSSAPSSSVGSTAPNGPFSSLLHFSHHPSQVQQNATAFISSGGLTSTTGHIASTSTTIPNQSFTQAQLSAQDSFGTVYSDRPEIEAQNNNSSTNSSSHRISVIKWQANGHL